MLGLGLVLRLGLAIVSKPEIGLVLVLGLVLRLGLAIVSKPEICQDSS